MVVTIKNSQIYEVYVNGERVSVNKQLEEEISKISQPKVKFI